MVEEQSLTEKIKWGHIAIIDSLNQIELSARSYNKAKPEIRALQDKLLAHFSSQPNTLYEDLKEKTQTDREKNKILEFLIYDLKNIKVKTLFFFDEHSGNLADLRPKNFPKDFADFSAEILSRIQMEEKYLLPLIDHDK